ncbi:MarR family winged helix-turn-helix transcriptional regulator [Bradyrhizobium canariense]|nr:MarR family transcriptional regulator [Bradyrhizobium canariense]
MTEPAHVSGLQDHLGYWLRYVSNQVSHAFSLKLAARDVTVAEWVMLRELYDQDAMVPSALADRLGMTRGAISKLVDRLAAKALLTGVPGTKDRRYQDLALTSGGRALVPELSGLADRNDAEFFGHLEPADRAAIHRLMVDIVRRSGLRTMPVD